MDKRRFLAHMLLPTLLIGVVACSNRNETATAGAKQTHFPGQVTAGGGTSGEVMGRAGQVTEGSYAGGTPGIAGGSGGTTGGPATAGTAQESGRGPAASTAPAGQTQGNR